MTGLTLGGAPSSVDFPKRRRRAGIACTRCHHRKVRCDLARGGSPCTNCRLDSATCTTFSSGKKRGGGARKRRRTASSDIKCSSTPSPCSSSISTEVEKDSTPPEKGMTPDFPEVSFHAYSFLELKGLSVIPQRQVQNLGRRGCLFVPTRPVLEEFLRKYFLFVHPALPLLTEAEIWSMYYGKPNRSAKDGHLSLFVFQCVLFASAGYFTSKCVREWGFSRVRDMRQFFYERAECIFQSGAEEDHLSLAQGAVLLSHYFCAATPFTGSSWLNTAIQNTILIRQKSEKSSMRASGQEDKNLRRLWWCVYLRDRLLPLGLRRPILITPSSYDMIIKSDALSILDEEIDRPSVYSASINRALIRLFQLQMLLADALTAVLSLVYPPYPCNVLQSSCGVLQITSVRIRQAESALAAWQEQAIDAISGSDIEHPSVTLFSKLMQMYYFAARIALCHYEATVTEASFQMANGNRHSCQKRLRDLQGDVYDASEGFRAIMDHFSNLALLQNLPLSALPCIAIPHILCTMDESLAGAQTTGCHDHPFGKVFTTCSDRFGGADAMIQFITNAHDSVKHLAGQEAHCRRGSQGDAEDLRSPLDKLCTQNLGPRHWGEILVEKPQLYMKVLSALDQSFATGKSPDEADVILDNNPTTKPMTEDVGQEKTGETGETGEAGDSGTYTLEAEGFETLVISPAFNPLDGWAEESPTYDLAKDRADPEIAPVRDRSLDDALWATTLFDTLYEISTA